MVRRIRRYLLPLLFGLAVFHESVSAEQRFPTDEHVRWLGDYQVAGDFEDIGRWGDQIIASNQYGVFYYNVHVDGSLELAGMYPGRGRTSGFVTIDSTYIVCIGPDQCLDIYPLDHPTGSSEHLSTSFSEIYVPQHSSSFLLGYCYYEDPFSVYIGIYNIQDISNPILIDSVDQYMSYVCQQDSIVYISGGRYPAEPGENGQIVIFHETSSDSLVFDTGVTIPLVEEYESDLQLPRGIICVGTKLVTFNYYPSLGSPFIIHIFDLSENPLVPVYQATHVYPPGESFMAPLHNITSMDYASVNDSILFLATDRGALASVIVSEDNEIEILDTEFLDFHHGDDCSDYMKPPLPVFGNTVYWITSHGIQAIDLSNPESMVLGYEFASFGEATNAQMLPNRFLLTHKGDSRKFSDWQADGLNISLIVDGSITGGFLDSFYVQSSSRFQDTLYVLDTSHETIVLDMDLEEQVCETGVTEYEGNVYYGAFYTNPSYSPITQVFQNASTPAGYIGSYYLNPATLQFDIADSVLIEYNRWRPLAINNNSCFWRGPGDFLYFGTNPANMDTSDLCQTEFDLGGTYYEFKTLGNYLYYDYGPMIRMINISDPANLYLAASINSQDDYNDYYPLDNTHVLTIGIDNIRIWEISEEETVSLVAEITKTTSDHLRNSVVGAVLQQDALWLCDGYVLSAFILEEDTSSVIESTSKDLPIDFTLYSAFPNPFNPSVTIPFTLASSQRLSIEVFDILGRRVTTLTEGLIPAGHHQVQWQGKSSSGQMVSAGTYFVRMKTEKSGTTVNRIILLK